MLPDGRVMVMGGPGSSTEFYETPSLNDHLDRWPPMAILEGAPYGDAVGGRAVAGGRRGRAQDAFGPRSSIAPPASGRHGRDGSSVENAPRLGAVGGRPGAGRRVGSGSPRRALRPGGGSMESGGGPWGRIGTSTPRPCSTTGACWSPVAQSRHLGTLTAPRSTTRRTDTWTATGALNHRRYWHTATLLTDGRVMVAGGQDGDPTWNDLGSAEIYDPATGTWTYTGATSRSDDGFTVPPSFMMAASSWPADTRAAAC